ncbi:MAG: histidine phosphatase family protein [Saprospiraceae bacterium]
MNIYIIRHGETELNRQGIVQGSGVDASLNEKGDRQALAFFEQYREVDFETIITSKLKRTHETIAPFLQKNLPWEQFAEINEISWGVMEGKKPDAGMVQRYQAITKAWDAGDFDAGVDGGESARMLGERLENFVSILKTRPEKNLLVCMHGRSLRALVCLLKAESLTQMSRFPHSNTGLYLVQYKDGQFNFHLENDTQHLADI